MQEQEQVQITSLAEDQAWEQGLITPIPMEGRQPGALALEVKLDTALEDRLAQALHNTMVSTQGSQGLARRLHL